MIRAKVIVRDGFYGIWFSGHARADVCAAASMMSHACALGLRDLAKQHPREIVFEQDVDFNGATKLDSTDRRKK